MVDATTTGEADRMMASLEKVSGGLGGLARSADELGKAQKTLTKDLLGRTKDAGKALTELGKSAGHAKNYIERLAVLGGVVGAMAKLVTMGNKLTDTYRQMSNIGSTFGGSIQEMAKLAGAAGMPLGAFAEAVKEAGTSARVMGEKGFANFERGLNKAMISHGMYAMTLDQVNKFSGQYLETSRRAGLITGRNNASLAKSFVELAGTTSALSNVTGKARDDITSLAQTALQSSMALSRIREMSGPAGEKANNGLQQAVTTMASQPGDAGSFFANALSETFGKNNRAEFSTQGQTLINAGMGDLAGRLSSLSNNPSANGAVDYMEEFRKEVGANLPSLRLLAMGGNQAAEELIKVQGQMAKMTREQLADARKKAETQDGLTKIFTSFGMWWDQLVGSFKAGFLSGFKPLFDSVGDFTKSKRVQAFADIVTTLGKKIGDGLGKLFKFILAGNGGGKIEKGIQKFGAWFDRINWAKTAVAAGVIFTGFAALGTIKWATLAAAFTAIGAALGYLSPIITALTGIMTRHKLASGLFLVGILAASKALKTWSMLQSIFGKKSMTAGLMTVRASVVNVIGGSPGGPTTTSSRDIAKGTSEGLWKRIKRGVRTGAEESAGYRGSSSRLGRLFGGAVGGASGALEGVGGLKGMLEGGKGMLGRFGGPLLATGLESLDYFFGDKAFTAKNFLKSGIALTGGGLGGMAGAALGALGGGVGAIPGGLAGGFAGYEGGKHLSNWLLGADDSKSAMAMAAASKGMGDNGIDQATDRLAGGDDDKAPTTKEDDPVVQKLNELIEHQKNGNDLMVGVAQGQAQIAKDQLSVMTSIKNQN